MSEFLTTANTARKQLNCGLIDQVHSSGLNDRFNPLEWVFCGSSQLICGRNNNEAAIPRFLLDSVQD